MGVIALFRHLCARVQVRTGRITEGYTFVRRIVVGVGVVAGGSSAVIVMMVGVELCAVVVHGVVNASCITR